MAVRNISCIVFRCKSPLPNKLRNKIFFTEDFIAKFTKVHNLIVINRNKDNTVFTQQVCSKTKTRVHHIQPVGVVASHRFRVRLCGLLGDLFVACHRVGKAVLIDKIVAGVVRRIDIDHLDLVVVRSLE